MSSNYGTEINPGHQLQLFLKELFPPDPKSETSFISKIDAFLIAEGDFAEVAYNSCINYLVRRFINTAEYIKRSCEKDGLSEPDRRFIVKLRSFISDDTHILEKHTEKLLAILIECLNVRKKDPSKKTKRRILKSAKSKHELYCYICGVVLDLDQEDQLSSAGVVDHVWPSSLGGKNEDFNLKVCCSNCNESKANYIDATDFHYEEICLISNKHDDSFSTELRRNYEVALWAKNKFKCTICDKPASQIGKLEFGRRNQNDSWHYLNIDAYCEKHFSE